MPRKAISRRDAKHLDLKHGRRSPELTHPSLFLLLLFLQIVLCVQQMEASSTPSASARMSLYSVTLQTMMDTYQCLVHLGGGEGPCKQRSIAHGTSALHDALLCSLTWCCTCTSACCCASVRVPY